MATNPTITHGKHNRSLDPFQFDSSFRLEEVGSLRDDLGL